MENKCFPRKNFRWRKDHPKVMRHVKSILKVSNKVNPEEQDKIKFPLTYNEVHEGERKLDESKAPKWVEC